MSAQPNILYADRDVYDGRTVNSAKVLDMNFDGNVPTTAQATEILLESLKLWESEKVNGVWFEVNLKHTFWIPILADNGFTFHRASGDESVMIRWLPKDLPNTLPLCPFTTIGVGGVVVNQKGEILLMKERRGIYLGWKFPGGMMDPGESITDAVQREVLEETGVNAKFQSILLFRHMNNAKNKTGDIYVLCYMKPVDESKIDIVRCEREAAAVQWMTREQIRNLPEKEFHRFHSMILTRLDALLESGSRGIYSEPFSIFNKMVWDMYYVDLPKKDAEKVNSNL